MVGARLKLTESIIELESRVQSLLSEIREIKMHVYALEEQNEKLSSKLFNGRPEQKGQQKLKELYEEGSHICPFYFAKIREEGEDCLFCLAFLKER